MQVLDIINEGPGSWLVGTAIAKEIAAKWARDIRIYQKEFKKIPTLDELKEFAPAEKYTTQADAITPGVEKSAYKQALDIIKADKNKLMMQGLEIIKDKLVNGASWFVYAINGLGVLATALGAGHAYSEYERKLNIGLKQLESGAFTGEQFKTWHDRIFIVMIGQMAIAIGSMASAGGFMAVISKMPAGHAASFFRNVFSTIPTGIIMAVESELLTNENVTKRIAQYMTAQGYYDSVTGEKEDPSLFGQGIEALFTQVAPFENWFKSMAFNAAKKAKMGEKIPPSVLPKEKQPNSAAPAPAASNNQSEPDAPVSGGIPNRPAQAAQPARSGAGEDWK